MNKLEFATIMLSELEMKELNQVTAFENELNLNTEMVILNKYPVRTTFSPVKRNNED